MPRIGLFNADESYTIGPYNISSSANNYTHQPLIPQSNLIITLTTVFIREISRNLTVNVTIEGEGMQTANTIS